MLLPIFLYEFRELKTNKNYDYSNVRKNLWQKKTTAQSEPLEKQLWKTADKLLKNIDATEYKHIASGLIFLK